MLSRGLRTKKVGVASLQRKRRLQEKRVVRLVSITQLEGGLQAALAVLEEHRRESPGPYSSKGARKAYRAFAVRTNRAVRAKADIYLKRGLPKSSKRTARQTVFFGGKPPIEALGIPPEIPQAVLVEPVVEDVSRPVRPERETDTKSRPPPLDYRPTIQPNAPAL
jgi:hypothetical protein